MEGVRYGHGRVEGREAGMLHLRSHSCSETMMLWCFCLHTWQSCWAGLEIPLELICYAR